MGVIQNSIDRGITLAAGMKRLSDKDKEQYAITNEIMRQNAFKTIYPDEAQAIETDINKGILAGNINASNISVERAKMYQTRIQAKQALEAEIENKALNKRDTVAHFNRSRSAKITAQGIHSPLEREMKYYG